MESLGAGEREKILSTNGLIDPDQENVPEEAGNDLGPQETERELTKEEGKENLPEAKTNEQSSENIENSG